MSELESDTTVTELRSFLGLCSVIGEFVPNFAWVAALLSKMLQKYSLAGLEQFTHEKNAAIKALQEKLLSSSVLALPYHGKIYT